MDEKEKIESIKFRYSAKSLYDPIKECFTCRKGNWFLKRDTYYTNDPSSDEICFNSLEDILSSLEGIPSKYQRVGGM